MANFVVEENFQFRGALRVRDNYLEVPDQVMVEQVELGKHEDSDKYISGLLNHCSPVDDHTRDLIDGKVKPKISASEAREAEAEVVKKKEIKRLRGEFDKLGKAFNPKWAIDKLQKELKLAKKSAGVPVAAKTKKDVIK